MTTTDTRIASITAQAGCSDHAVTDPAQHVSTAEGMGTAMALRGNNVRRRVDGRWARTQVRSMRHPAWPANARAADQRRSAQRPEWLRGSGRPARRATRTAHPEEHAA